MHRREENIIFARTLPATITTKKTIFSGESSYKIHQHILLNTSKPLHVSSNNSSSYQKQWDIITM